MIESSTLRWLLSMALRSPVAWLLVACTASAWPLVVTLLSLGLTTSSKPPVTALYELGFLASQVGAVLAVLTLSESSWWLSRTTPWRRFRVEFTAVATGSFALIVAVWLIPATLSFGQDTYPVAHMLSTALLSSLHLAAIAVCILALPIGSLGRACLVPFCVWFMPGFLSGHHWSMQGIRQCFELAAVFQFPWTEESPASGWPVSILPILGLCLLRMAEATRRATRPCATRS